MVQRRWESITGNLGLTTELQRKLGTIKSLKANISSVSPSSIALTKGERSKCQPLYGAQFTFSTQLLTQDYPL